MESAKILPRADTAARNKRILVAFDFDHTIVNDNSDTFILSLLDTPLPEEIEDVRGEKGWTEYMDAIYGHLHSLGISTAAIHQHQERVPLVEGVKEFLEFLSTNKDIVDCAIISDANGLFIPWILEAHHLLEVFTGRIHTNPAWIDDTDRMHIAFYHTNTWCELSARNICKGAVLRRLCYPNAQQEDVPSAAEELLKPLDDGCLYDCVIFVGDGQNDYCPSLRLRPQDFVFARQRFQLVNLLKKNAELVKAGVFTWATGYDMLEKTKTIIKR
ncbi:pyridoxal phosphate phosphatase PHOSPHO2-like [Paramacrobiotus metropolitanus]|uniref:pyridoxal phosphate phosphatase PHOSPHO2-like n=1 Tax=Paramacrobiotus metropolitanus TaxID=2943436 RepID=UPI002445FC3C|nr:pyridoxal phosphate phosphatase PHOSPHO2-like [Paramacrobiotus metropolitanus]XP_055354160.1 pyridoxal phosphate phosphatase PHOSPHO2-like [Paramacrobiotus metropolitanus]XP_055354161.1 pyridoxal phosphate phosphatase PHOSPHO2-like [Paramacrobiotus metropolitanus]